MDANGYIDSIIPGHDEYTCWLCKQNGRGKMDRHEVFRGAYRQKSKALGLWVHLCHSPCHQPIIHSNGEEDERLRIEAQEYAMAYYGWTKEQFIHELGKSYI